MWYVIGTIGYSSSLGVSADELAALPAAAREALTLRPTWFTPVALISLAAGLLGSVGLVVGRHWALPLFIVSLVSNLLYAYAALVIIGAYRLFGAGSVIVQVGTVAICAGLAWLAWRAGRSGWLA